MKPSFFLKYVLVVLSLVWYVIVYHFLDRHEFWFFISGIAILGFSYFYWIVKNSFGPKEIIVLAVLFRSVFLVGTPNLSDDYYRFYWDGSLIAANPYEHTPQEYKNFMQGELSDELQEAYPLLNSQTYFSVYPPVNQLFFKSAFFLAQGSLSWFVFYLKLFIFFFDIALIFLLIQFLRRLMLPIALAQVYALNPLVIIELTGNLHFEGVMMFFLIAGVYFLWRNKVVWASLAIGLSIGVKLIPILILPLILPLLGIKKSIKLYLGIIFFLVVVSLPFLSSTILHNFSESIALYFQTFEFNASFYYLAKQLSIYLLGYKSYLVGNVLSFLVFMFIISLCFILWKKHPKPLENSFRVSLFMKYAGYSFAFYYLLSSTVHPWYLINVVALSVFSFSRSYVLWSLLVFLSYFAYSSSVRAHAPNLDFNLYSPYYYFIVVQYGVVLFLFIFDASKKKQA